MAASKACWAPAASIGTLLGTAPVGGTGHPRSPVHPTSSRAAASPGITNFFITPPSIQPSPGQVAAGLTLGLRKHELALVDLGHSGSVAWDAALAALRRSCRPGQPPFSTLTEVRVRCRSADRVNPPMNQEMGEVKRIQVVRFWQALLGSHRALIEDVVSGVVGCPLYAAHSPSVRTTAAVEAWVAP